MKATVVVVVLVVTPVLFARRIDFGHRAEYHRDRWFEEASSPGGIHGKAEYHKAMELKYRRAAHCPWLPVARDLPEPKVTP